MQQVRTDLEKLLPKLQMSKSDDSQTSDTLLDILGYDKPEKIMSNIQVELSNS